MADDFELDVSYNNQTLHLPIKLIPFGYTYKLEITINNTPVYFERDEERNWRAMTNEEDSKKRNAVSKELLQAVAEALDDLLK